MNTYYDSLTAVGPSFWVSSSIVTIFMVIVIWIIFKKAGKPGWAAIIPIYNIIVMLDIIKMDWWHILIMIFVPFASIIYSCIFAYKLSIMFGKSSGFGVFAIFFTIIAYPIIAFGESKYQG